MERIKISRNLETGKYVAFGTALVLFIVLFYARKDINTVIPCVALILIAGVLYYLFENAKTVEFDELNMFISGKEVNEVVPLINVFSIKLTMTQINDDSIWKIKYVGKDCYRTAVRILPMPYNFELFKKVVREKSPTVEIKIMSHSFDLDQ